MVAPVLVGPLTCARTLSTSKMYSADPNDLNGSPVATTTAILPKYPSEEPTKKEHSEWLDASCAILSRTGYGPALRGETPPGFLQLKFQMAMPELPELADDERVKMGPVEAAKYTLLRAETSRKKAAATEAYESGMREYKNKLAATLDVSMRKTAPLRLSSMQHKHADPNHTGIYDGGAMWRDLDAMRNAASRIDDRRQHDRAVELARDSALPDGCTANTYLKKVNDLYNEHIPYMERPYTGHAMGSFLIGLMPKANAIGGRMLETELDKSGTDKTLSDGPYVIERCASIVLKSQSTNTAFGTVASALAAADTVPAMRPLCEALRAAKLTTAAALTRAASGSPKGKDKDKDKDKKKSSSRLAPGELCPEGTCNFNHAKFAPGSRCYRSPHFNGPLEERFMRDPAQLDRLDAAREANAKKMGVPFVPLPRPKIPVNSIVPVQTHGFDEGLDYFETCDVPAALFLPFGPIVPSPPPSPPESEVDSNFFLSVGTFSLRTLYT